MYIGTNKIFAVVPDDYMLYNYELGKKHNDIYVTVSNKEGEYKKSENFSYFLSDNKIRILEGQKDLEGEFQIPDAIGGVPVLEIGQGAFAGAKFSKVVIGENVEVIDNYAFRNCGELESVTLPKHLEKIGNEAFFRCEKLKDVSIPENTKFVARNAFSSTGANESVRERLFEMRKKELEKCEIVAIESEDAFKYELITEYDSTIKITGFRVLNDSTSGKLYKIIIPERIADHIVREVECAAVNEKALKIDILSSDSESVKVDKYYRKLNSENSSILEVTLPETVHRIGAGAFSNLINLEVVNLPSEEIEVGDFAFMNCQSLEKVNLERVKKLGKFSFAGTRLKSVTLHQKLKAIKDGTFQNCKALKEVNLPKSVKTLESEAFYGCSMLERINLGNVKKIGENVFSGCPKLEN